MKKKDGEKKITKYAWGAFHVSETKWSSEAYIMILIGFLSVMY